MRRISHVLVTVLVALPTPALAELVGKAPTISTTTWQVQESTTDRSAESGVQRAAGDVRPQNAQIEASTAADTPDASEVSIASEVSTVNEVSTTSEVSTGTNTPVTTELSEVVWEIKRSTVAPARNQNPGAAAVAVERDLRQISSKDQFQAESQQLNQSAKNTPSEVTDTDAPVAEAPVNAMTGARLKEVPAVYKNPSEVIISKVMFEGNTVFADDILADIAEPYLNRALGVADLEQLRVQLSQFYVDTGYINSGARLPGQEVENGEITYEIVEGRLEDISVTGTDRLRDRYIVDRVLRGANAPFNTRLLQRNFQLLLDDPLIDRMDGKLTPLPGLGASKLDLDVTRARPYDFSISADNHVSPSLGSEQVQLQGQVRNIAGLGDQFGVTAAISESRTSLNSEYLVPLNSRDTKLRVRLSISDSGVIEEPLDAIDIDSDTSGTDISVLHPIRLESRNQYSVGAGLSVRRNRNLLAGEPFSFSIGEDDGVSRVTVLRAWQEYIRRKDSRVVAARTSLNIGLDAFDSTIHADGRPDSEFVSLQAQVQYVQRFFEDRGQLLLKLDSQFANQTLLPLEKFSIGGANSVRGYRENEVVRDRALFLSAEWRFRFHESGRFGRWSIAPFIDYGIGGNKGQFTAEEVLNSVGAGLLWNMKNRIAAELYFGHTLQDPPNSEGSTLQDNGVHFSLRTQF